ncbi:DUF3575 domain-containing protein [Rikenella microfusus]
MCLAGSGGHVAAQVPGLGTPQKQTIAFTFGLGSAELDERYGQNAAAMEKFGELLRQLAETPSAHIDSIVVVSYSTTAEQLGSVEVAGRRIDAVKAYMEPLIRRSGLRQSVVVTGNVVARNNVLTPDRMFDMLKKTTVTLYLNGVLVARNSESLRFPASAAEEERRYISPFGGEETDIFGRNERPAREGRMPAAPKRSGREAEEKPRIAAVPSQPVSAGKENPADGTDMDRELQRFVDSLISAERPDTMDMKGGEIGTIPPPPAPVITEEEPCPEERDPGIDDLIRRMLAEEAATEAVAGKTGPEAVAGRAGIVVGGRDGRSAVAAVPEGDGRKIGAKPAKEPKVKPVKPVRDSREPLVLARPLVAVKTNLAYWAAVAANLEVEFYFAQRWSASVEGIYTDWNMNLYKKHYAVNEISPELRYWFGRRTGQYRGCYVGVYGHAGQFDYMFRGEQTGNTGDYYGAGLSLGAYLPFTPRFGLELGLRGGWVHAGDYDRYGYEAPRYVYRSSHTADYFGLTGAKVSLVYRFGTVGTGRR